MNIRSYKYWTIGSSLFAIFALAFAKLTLFGIYFDKEVSGKTRS